MTVCLPLFRVNNYNLAVQGWDLDEGVEHGPAEVGGRNDLNRCNNALNQMVVDLDCRTQLQNLSYKLFCNPGAVNNISKASLICPKSPLFARAVYLNL